MATLPLEGGRELSKTLALHVQNLLKEHSFQPELIAVGAGPGSYTGIRVGVALAKALAFGWKIPILSFCSLRAFMAPSATAVLVDARMGGFYTLKKGEDKAVLLTPEAALNEFKNSPILASPHPDLIRKRLDIPCEWIETWPDANSIAKEEFEALALTYP